ncbi:MAG: hypothetical protein HUU35_14960, partial [Armatimonadetes bacterium]|nr:hypothetical protein [Armatimonadota bacterium]
MAAGRLVVELGEVTATAGKPRTERQLLIPVGRWSHPKYGKIEVTPERIQRFAQRFERGRWRRAVRLGRRSPPGARGLWSPSSGGYARRVSFAVWRGAGWHRA